MVVRATYTTLTVVFSGLLSLALGKIVHLSWPVVAALTAGLSLYLLFTNPLSAAPAEPLPAILEAIRAKYKVPALAGALFTTDKLVEFAAVGVRKTGTTVPVTTDDLWHLGSDTKAMTAMLAGSYVAEKKLSWNDKIISFFPDLADKVPAAMREITVAQVLSHRAGLIENLPWRVLSLGGTVEQQRRNAVEQALMSPAYAPGTYHYANTDYVVIGAILEKIGGKSWETLIQERIFKPLGMTSIGFGGLGTPGVVDQPWPHDANGNALPFNGPLVDNPEVMGPAGNVHCTVQDWSKFLIDQLRGCTGMKALLPNEVYTAIQTPVPPTDYSYGWITCNRTWAGGRALNHAGSNTMNFCVAWLAPGKKFGVLACCNQGGDTAFKACDEVASILIQRHSITP